MDTTLVATTRGNNLGKGGARKARKAGRVPGSVYGPGFQPMNVEVEPHPLVEMFRKSQNRNTVVHLQADGETFPCLVREVQRHPLSREILHVDFCRMSPGRNVIVPVIIRPTGKAKALALGGRVMVVRRTLEVRCAFDKIPEALEFDVTAPS